MKTKPLASQNTHFSIYIQDMNKVYLCCFCFLLCSPLFAQLSDSFSDGNFTANPTWTGDVTNFTINPNGQLQSNGPAATATISLFTANTQCSNTEWQFRLTLNFSPTTSNHAKVYLMSDQANLKGNLNGYYVRVGEGGSTDGVDLYRQQGNVHTKIIDGIAGRAAVNPNLRVKVIRDATGNWQLFSDNTGGSNFINEGAVTDSTFRTTAYFGVFCSHSSTRRQGFFFDDFVIREAPVSLMSAAALTATQVKVTFSTTLDATTASDASRYALNKTITVQSAQISGENDNEVMLTLANPLQTDTYTLTVNGVLDQNGNSIPANSTVIFTYIVPIRYREIVINEIFADESPRVDLPQAEYVELFNPTNRNINLLGCTLADSSMEVTLPEYLLPAGGYVILCKSTFQAEFAVYGPALGLSTFPSLNNAGDQLILRNSQGQLIDQVSYTEAWYGSETKKEGGWSLEMIDVQHYCNEIRNWAASENPAGGTPGQLNSIAASRPDVTPPQTIQAEASDAQHIQVFFDEKLDSTAMAQPSLYAISDGVSIIQAKPISPQFTAVELTVSAYLLPKTIYTLTVRYAKDCTGNSNGHDLRTSFALPEPGDSGDVVVNEILFNPRSGGVDFVELYNRSGKYINLKDWKIANLEEGNPANHKAITSGNYILAPGQYGVLTTKGMVLKDQYPKAKDSTFILLSSLPSLPDDAGSVVLLNEKNVPVDQVSYDEKQHFALVNDKAGVSLERISFHEKSDNTQNWHSAASTEGYATPGYYNSQALLPDLLTTGFRVEPPVFTPDEDGNQDFTTLQYHLPGPGNVASVTVFDTFGREVRKVAQNVLLATEGFFTWDGTNSRGEKVRTGRYIVHVSVYNLQGKGQSIKKEVVVGARF